jgi:integrase
MGLLGKLTDVKCRTAGPGTHGDGGGLLLQVRQGANGLTRSWVYRYTVAGKQHWVGLGSYPIVTLARAREKAMDARRQRSDGHDPLSTKRAVRAAVRQPVASKSVTFEQAAREYLAAREAGWRSRKHAYQWQHTLTDYVYPIIGSMQVGEISTEDVLRVLQPIWNSKPVTAARVRERIENILDAAQVRGYRRGENCARWKGHLDHLLPRPSKIRAVTHHAAMPYAEVAGFLRALRERDAIAPRALEMIVLTAARAGEVLGMTMAEVDLELRLWTIAGSRMKSGRQHRVPLSDQAIDLVKRMPRTGERIFPCALTTIDLLRKRMGIGVTAHGFRSTFRTWAAECTPSAREIIEECLAHRTGDATELAYQRSDIVEKRRQLMQLWADYCTATGTVVPLRAVS